MYLSVVFVISLTVIAAIPINLDPALNDEWEAFKSEFKKIYEEQEEIFRRLTWESHRYLIDLHNKKADAKVHTFYLAMNEYGDLTHTEFVKLMNGYMGKPINKTSHKTYASKDLPESVDWREHGYVTPVKNQGACGSCWAFSTTGALEGQHFKQTNNLVSLSEQNLVDCSFPEGNNGCHGGLMDQAFTYIKENGGIDTEESYPYTAQESDCHYNKSNRAATDIGYQDVESGSEEALQEAIATVGPISAAIDAGTFSFRFYKKGVFSDEDCSPERLDHGILVVGYGTDVENQKDYWIVKNSWGGTWGMDGYILMSRNNDNNCGIATQASYPLVAQP